MTLLKVYNKNGHCRPMDAPAFGFSNLLNEYPFRDQYHTESHFGSPRVNIKEETNNFKIEMEVPGINKELLKMEIVKDLLTISYKNEEVAKEERFTYREFNNQNFERNFRVPETVNKDDISASYHEGILLVNLPKKDEAIEKGPRNIEIS
jgi:HSP20 family protein